MALCTPNPPSLCEADGCQTPSLAVSFCIDCDSSFCSRFKKGRYGVPHEKLDVEALRRLRAAAQSSLTVEGRKHMLRAVKASRWLHLARSSTKISLQDFGRLPELLAEIRIQQVPHLITVAGTPGAGKTFVTKLLIQLAFPHEAENLGSAIPITSKANRYENVPLADIHLYAHPQMCSQQRRMLFADFEMLDNAVDASASNCAAAEPTAPSRGITWATGEKDHRHTVSNILYPSLLYTLSDCVLFVLGNTRNLSTALWETLLHWGMTALGASINQPFLPHCVIIMNNTDSAVDVREWDSDCAKQTFLRALPDYRDGPPRFRRLINLWRSLGYSIDTAEHLILRYYSSLSVIRLPSLDNYGRLHIQTARLRRILEQVCRTAQESKAPGLFPDNSEEFVRYFQFAMDHYTTHRTTPLDLIKWSDSFERAPPTFGEHILRLCRGLKPSRNLENDIFTEIAGFVASCAVLELSRSGARLTGSSVMSSEAASFYAISQYVKFNRQCAFTSSLNSRRCGLCKASHGKRGHQDEYGIIQKGRYQAPHQSSEAFVEWWMELIRSQVAVLLQTLAVRTGPNKTHHAGDSTIAWNLHIRRMSRFVTRTQSEALLTSHATCYACLMHSPAHVLSCRHALCENCIKDNGKAFHGSVFNYQCPLHQAENHKIRPYKTILKSKEAGVRTLVLEDGGVRAALQLEMLTAIQRWLSGGLQVLDLFDLVVGTGTGALLAALLCKPALTLERCTESYLSDFAPAFNSAFVDTDDIKRLGRPGGSSLSQTLTETFGAHYMFGNPGQFRDGIRIAVLTIDNLTGKPVVAANYRHEHREPSYALQRQHVPEREVKTWQVIATSLSGSPAFRSVASPATHLAYSEGSRLDENLAYIAFRESQCFHRGASLDMLLSLGSGWLSGQGKDRQVEDAWQNFRTAVQREAKPSVVLRLNRLNPEIESPPAMTECNRRVFRLAQSRLFSMQAANIAGRLVASQFYFELVEHSLRGENGAYEIRGQIACRFEEGSAFLRSLGRHLRNFMAADKPSFFVYPDEDVARFIQIPLELSVIQGMIVEGVFSKFSLSFSSNNPCCSTAITFLPMARDTPGSRGFPISGFPRTFSYQSEIYHYGTDEGPKISRMQLNDRTSSKEQDDESEHLKDMRMPEILETIDTFLKDMKHY